MLASVLALVLVILHPYLQCYASSPVIIIGAGPAGVAAATRLLDNNYTNILVLEASSRIGGRIRSVKFGDAYVDLGAHWCHGEKDNVVYDLVKDLDLLRSTSGTDSRIYHSSKRVSQELNDELHQVVGSTFGAKTKGVRESVEDYYFALYNQTILSKYQNDSDNLQIASSTRRLLEQLILAHRGAFSLSTTIVDRDYKICEGDLRLNWNGNGYKTILDVLIRTIPDRSKQLPFYEKLLLNKEVTNIAWNGTNGNITVSCSDGSIYAAAQVIFTPSVGVLKYNHKTLFSPPLPEDKQIAIENIGLDAIVDVSFYFPERWWPHDDDFRGFYFVWDEEDANDVIKQTNGSAWILDAFNIIPTERNPNVLTLWITGSSVRDAELISNEELINGTLYLLNRFLGQDYNVSKPTDLIRSDWYSNPYFRGSYSYQTQKAFESDPSAEVVLSQPLLNQDNLTLLFAGEATHPHFYSTVHGAIETGHREANRILENLFV